MAESPLINAEGLVTTKLVLDGTEIGPEYHINLIEVVVDMSFGGPDMITIVFADFDITTGQSSGLAKLGQAVEVGLGYNDTTVTVAKGEVISIEVQIGADGIYLTTLRAYNKMNRLYRGRKTRSFTKIKDSEIASTIAGDHGLTSDADVTDTVHEYVVQWNMTDMEFLQERARRNGYRVYADAAKLYFKQEQNVGAPVLTLTLGGDIISFRPRVSLAQQVTSVAVRGWDIKQKAALNGTATTNSNLNQGGIGGIGSAKISTVAATEPFSIIDHNLLDATDAQKYAEGVLAGINRTFIEGEISFQGSALVVPGKLIEIKNVGDIFNGEYVVTTVQHDASNGNWITTAGISSPDFDRVGRLINGAPEPARAEGVYPAIVTSLTDPEALNRVQVEFPWMPQKSGANLASSWMRIAAPMSGNGIGMLFMPEIGDEVLVAFQGGDPNTGYIVGGLWNGQQKPKYPDSASVADGKVLKRAITLMSGHELLFNEEAGKEAITLVDKAGNTMLFDSANKLIKFTAIKDMTFDITGNLNIKATGNIVMESTGTTDIKSTGALTLDSKAAATLKGLSVSVSGQTTAEVKANATLTLSASGMTELKGSLVKIN
jgi:phage protein D/phage baseplate assembly protein gpV